MNEQEKIVDIIAEMREIAAEKYRLSSENGGAYGNPGVYYLDFAQFARVISDRLEAAHKRERGDCAKLRKAVEKTRATLEEALQILNGISDEEAGTLNARLEDVADEICEVTQWIIPDALAAPPRNCDVYNSESCRLAYHLHGDGLMTMQAFADWLFAPATEKEGGAK